VIRCEQITIQDSLGRVKVVLRLFSPLWLGMEENFDAVRLSHIRIIHQVGLTIIPESNEINLTVVKLLAGEHGVFFAPYFCCPHPGSISKGSAPLLTGWDWRPEKAFWDMIIDVVGCFQKEYISLR